MQQKKLIQNLNKLNKIKKYFFYILILSSSALFFTFSYGYKGVFPIDSFLIYDAGYKIFNGYHPFKDYWSITGPILDYFQFFFFKLFGINWFSYVLHAATINLLLTILVFYFFLKLGLNKNYSILYSLSSSILAYPSVGTPFMDHHAVIFSLISLIYLILAIKLEKNIYWFVLPVLLLISFLSKQIPSSYLLILFFIAIFIHFFLISARKTDILLYLSASSILSLIIIAFVFYANQIPFKNFLIQYINYPIGIGETRSSNISFNFNNVISQFKFIHFSILPLIFVLFIILKKTKKSFEIKKDILIIILSISSTLIFIYSQILTKNQILIFFLIPFVLGMSHYFLKKYYENKIIISFLILVLIFSTSKYHLRFNVDKKFMELSNVDLNLAINAESLDNSIKGLKWITPNYRSDPIIEINLLSELKKSILDDGTKKIVITDYQILPSIVKINNTSPNKWFDFLSVPKEGDIFYEIYKDFFIRKLKEQNIETIYLTGNHEVFLVNILKKGCYEKELINKISFKINIKKCLR